MARYAQLETQDDGVGILASMSLLRLQQLKVELEEIRNALFESSSSCAGIESQIKQKGCNEELSRRLVQQCGRCAVAGKRLDQLERRLVNATPDEEPNSSENSADTAARSPEDDSSYENSEEALEQKDPDVCGSGQVVNDMMSIGVAAAAAELEARYREALDRRGCEEVRTLRNEVVSLVQDVRGELAAQQEELDRIVGMERESTAGRFSQGSSMKCTPRMEKTPEHETSRNEERITSSNREWAQSPRSLQVSNVHQENQSDKTLAMPNRPKIKLQESRNGHSCSICSIS